MKFDHAHRRLLNAVISYQGATQNGSQAEIQAAAIELKAAQDESQELLYPDQSGKKPKRGNENGKGNQRFEKLD